MSILIRCQKCRDSYEVEDDLAGKAILCRICDGYVKVPERKKKSRLPLVILAGTATALFALFSVAVTLRWTSKPAPLPSALPTVIPQPAVIPQLDGSEEEYQRLQQEIETQRQKVEALQKRLGRPHQSQIDLQAYEKEQRALLIPPAQEELQKAQQRLIELAGRRTFQEELEYEKQKLLVVPQAQLRLAEAEAKVARAVAERALPVRKELENELKEFHEAVLVLEQLYGLLAAALRDRMAVQGVRSGDHVELEQISQERMRLREIIHAGAR